MTKFDHVTVLKAETIELVLANFEKYQNQDDLLFADCTLGGAGHTIHLLEQLTTKVQRSNLSSRKIEIVCCDQDSLALQVASERIALWKERSQLADSSPKVTLINENFSQLPAWLKSNRPTKKLNGLIADLGVSSPQLDHAERGFSFLKSGPLDMRMNNQNGITAKQLIETSTESELSQIFTSYGEEPRARALAKAIVKDRSLGTLPMSNTVTFAEYVARVLGYHQSRVHPATRIFQALRIAVNEELSSVESLLQDIPSIISNNGTAALISFHSLEDRIVKQYFRAWENACASPAQKKKNDKQNWLESQMGIPTQTASDRKSFGAETPRGGILASDEEVKLNPRSRSARLRGFCFSDPK
ncbi:MAG: rRNA ((1402)-N(4))-methyltransferase RsmH [Pseudomonadota bacterium]